MMAPRPHAGRWLPLTLWLLILGHADARAQSVTPGPGPAPTGNVSEADRLAGVALADSVAGVPLIFESDTIVVLHGSVVGIPPRTRIDIALRRLLELHRTQMLQTVRAGPIMGGYMVLIGDTYAFIVADGDADVRAGLDTRATAEEAVRKLQRALAVRARRLTPGSRLGAVLIAVLATLMLVAFFPLFGWVRRRLTAWLSTFAHTSEERLRLRGLNLLGHLGPALSRIAGVAQWALGLLLTGLWALFVLSLFPETERWGAGVRQYVLDLLHTFQADTLRAIPGIVAVLVIVIVARFLTGLTDEIFRGIERGGIRLLGIHPETAGATRRLVNTMIWLFVLVVAYPFLPGSDSEAFKGVSVFLGLLITLGSSGMVGHLMSGLVLVYSRALKPGDFVRVNDIEGTVTEVGALSVKIANYRQEEITIPNAVVVGTTVKNYTRLGADAGPPMTSSVTIGYDAPWRVVHEMLLAAADRTTGIRKQPAPFVVQSELSDFFVVYQLVARLEWAAPRIEVLSRLHQNIQDAFNERGIQIMSPHFEGQPENRVMVPKSRWSQAPNDPSGPAGA